MNTNSRIRQIEKALAQAGQEQPPAQIVIYKRYENKPDEIVELLPGGKERPLDANGNKALILLPDNGR